MTSKEAVIRDFLKTLQQGFLEDEGKKYTLKELRVRFDYEIQHNVISDWENKIWN